MASAILIKSPTDFAKTIGAQQTSQIILVSPPSAIEPHFRQLIGEIFDDLQYIDQTERGLVSTYLNGIEAPLKKIHSMGFAIFAITTTGTMFLEQNKPISNWNTVYYLIVPLNGFFRIGEELSTIIHRFDANCEAVVSGLARAVEHGSNICVWGDKKTISQQLEGNVPWCINCCLEL